MGLELLYKETTSVEEYLADQNTAKIQHLVFNEPLDIFYSRQFLS